MGEGNSLEIAAQARSQAGVGGRGVWKRAHENTYGSVLNFLGFRMTLGAEVYLCRNANVSKRPEDRIN